jgi:carbon monoxide dehydrogenase subunit G
MELNHSFTVPVGVDRAFEVLTDIERIAPCMPGASIDSVDGDEFTGKVKVKVGPMQVTYRGKAKYAELDRDNHSAVIEARAQEMRGSGTANATITADLTEQGADETEVTVVSNLSITGRPAQFGRGVMNEVGAKLLNKFADCLASRLAGDDDADEQDESSSTPEQPVSSGAGSNGSSAAASEQEITQSAGAAPTQPASGAAAAAATAAPSAAATTSGATPADAATERSAPSETAGAPTTTPRQTSDEDIEAIDLFDVAGASIAKRAIPAAVVALVLILLFWRRRSS